MYVACGHQSKLWHISKQRKAQEAGKREVHVVSLGRGVSLLYFSVPQVLAYKIAGWILVFCLFCHIVTERCRGEVCMREVLC